MKNIWKGQDNHTKLKILRACIFPSATYGCETWTLNRAALKSISGFEMKCYRRILRISWTERRTNRSIREELNVEEDWLETYVKRQKLRFFGHIKRHESLSKIIMEGIVEGKRGRGRPRRQWERDIMEMLSKTVTEAGRLAQDRDIYREAVKDATSSRISG